MTHIQHAVDHSTLIILSINQATSLQAILKAPSGVVGSLIKPNIWRLILRLLHDRAELFRT